MSTTTDNFNLIKPDLSDAADITAMNENWDKVDERLGQNHIHSYTTLEQFGLSDDQMSPTDFSSNMDAIITKLDGKPATLMLTLQSDANKNPNLHASLVAKLNEDTDITFTVNDHVGWLSINFSGQMYRPVVIETNLETANYYDSVWICVFNKGGSGNQISAFTTYANKPSGTYTGAQIPVSRNITIGGSGILLVKSSSELAFVDSNGAFILSNVTGTISWSKSAFIKFTNGVLTTKNNDSTLNITDTTYYYQVL